MGDGRFMIAPGKPTTAATEVGTKRAAEILGVGTSAMRAARESKLGQRILRWRFTSDSQRIIRWELMSVLEYRQATKGIGK
jgi:hypothetical protein